MRASHLLLFIAVFAGCTRPTAPAPPPTPVAAPCATSAGCTPAEACVAGTCAAQPPCFGTTHCGADQVCSDGACHPCGACVRDDECPAHNICVHDDRGCTSCTPAAVATLPDLPTPTEPTEPTEPTPPTADPKALLYAMEDAYSKVRDYTLTLVRRERVKGKLLAQETMQVKFRKPYSTYIRWTGSVYKGREALYIRGKNDNKLRAHQGSFPDVTVDIDPRGGLAMKGNRHPITEGSLGDLIGLLVRDLRRAESRPQDGAIIKDLGESDRHGQKIRCFDAIFTVADGYYAPHVQICVFTATNLPSRVQVWDAREQLLEDYEYRDLKTNVGLRDADFDSTNPKYNF